VSRPSLARRLLASSLAGLALLLALGGTTLSWSFRRSAEAAFDERLDAWSQAIVAALVSLPDGRVEVTRPAGDPRFERPLSGWYWDVTEGDARLAASRSLWDAELARVAAATGATRVAAITGPRGQALRAIARETTLPGRDGVLRVQVAVDDGEVRREIERFDALLLAALGALGIGILALGFVQMRLALRPLRAIERDLAAVRAGDPGRIGVTAPRELASLVDSLDALLEHDEKLVQRARAHAADLAHAIKTPLSLIRAEAQEIGGERGERVARHADAIARHTERRLVRATALPAVAGRRTPLRPVARAIADTLARLHPHCAIEVDVAEELYFRGAQEDLEEILGNLMENACKWARGRVRVVARGDATGLEIAIEDDGAGLDPAERVRARERGARLDEQAPGSGLGLAIVEEVVALHDGSLHLEDAALGGLRAVVRLPAAG
jgi:signal transduction histidine kinase